MTKLSNIPAKETTAKTAKTRKAKTAPAKPKWDLTNRIKFTNKGTGKLNITILEVRYIHLNK